MGRARSARSDPVDERRRVGDGRGRAVARPEPAARPARRRAAGRDDASTRRSRWRSATSRRWPASASPRCPPTTGRAASAPTARRRSRRRRRWRRPSTAASPAPTARRSAPRRAARASTGGSGRRWTSRARRWPGASPRTSARTRSSPARRSPRRSPARRAVHVIATLKHYVANNAGVGPHRLQHPDGAPAAASTRSSPSGRCRRSTRRRSSARSARPTADAVMCSYNRLNGPQTCESSALLSDLKASGFDGFVAPDFIFAVKDPLAATLAGLDVPALGGAGGRTAAMFTSGQVPRRAAGRHRPAHALRDVRLGRLRRPARAGGRERQHARAPGAGDAGVGSRHGAAQERPPRAAARRRTGCARSRSSAPRATTPSTSAAARRP